MREYIEWLKTDKYLHDWFLLSMGVFILALVFSVFLGISIPEKSLVVQEAINNNTTHSVISNPIIQGATILLVIAIVLNNYILCIMGIYTLPWIKSKILRRLLGFILIPYQGFISGISLAPFMLKWGIIMTLAIIVPHGIFEIPALILSFSTGMAVLHQDTQKRKYLQKNTLILSLTLLILASIVEVSFSPIFAQFIYQFIFG